MCSNESFIFYILVHPFKFVNKSNQTASRSQFVQIYGDYSEILVVRKLWTFMLPVFRYTLCHYEKRLCNIRQYFTAVKKKKFMGIFFYIFLIFAQNIDSGYTLEPPQCFRAKI